MKGADIKAAAAITKLLGTEGFRREGKTNHQACSIDFELLGEIARRMYDPDYRMCELMREGVPIGWQQRLPRTPAIYDRKTRWWSHVGEEGDNEGWKANYRSAVEHRGEIEKTFREQEAEKLMVPFKVKDGGKRIYGNRLRVAALGALEQAPGEFRVIHDGTHGVSVNNFIKDRDQEACPLARDLLSGLDWFSMRARPTGGCPSRLQTGGYRPAHFVLIGLHQAPRTSSGTTQLGPTGWAAPPTGGPGRAH